MSFYIEKIDHVQLAAPSNKEDLAREFYRDLLGFEEIEKPQTLRKRGGAWFRVGSVHVHVGVEENFRAAKKAHPAFHVKNIEAMKQYLRNKGVEPQLDDSLPGANRFYLYDPFGNRLEFLEWMHS
ncbi:VOC family protein [Lentibacillus sp. L22]|uniref:VOC family protein n=1 Tax=Lentibacillus TaxID=175304 RepID=UPI0022B11BA2|nr:VOC family protein [Lentibacillus daqui]